MASPQDFQGSLELSRVCLVLQKVYQRVFSDGTAINEAHSEEHSVQVGFPVLRSL